LNSSNGTRLINIRKWFEAEDGSVRPTKHGVALALKHLPRPNEAIWQAVAVAADRGLIPSADAGEDGSQ
jgi:hypothetical protein